MDDVPDLLTVPEVAAILRLSPDAVYELCRAGKLPRYKFGASVRIDRADLMAFARGCRREDAEQGARMTLRHVRLR